MMGVAVAFAWLGVVLIGLLGCAIFERFVRLAGSRESRRWASPRAAWGFDADDPPAYSAVARGLAACARLVRSRTEVGDRSAGLRLAGRVVSCLALAAGLGLIPFAGTWGGGPSDAALIVIDLRHGLVALLLVYALMGLSQVGVGLADRNHWSRIGAAGLASQTLAGIGLLAVLLATLAIGPASFRLQDIVSAQQATFSPFFWLLPATVEFGVEGGVDGGVAAQALELMRAIQIPAWHVFTQPLTAVLVLWTLHFLAQRPRANDPVAATMHTTGFGLDHDPSDLYWGRLEARLAEVFASAVFVALFLGAAGLPFVSASALVERLEPLVGFALPALLVVLVGTAVFASKMAALLYLGALIRRSTARVRGEQKIRIVVFRLMPLAWANLLLVAAVSLWARRVPESLAAPMSGGG